MKESFEYDEAGNRVLVVDGLGQATRMSYDGMGRLLTTNTGKGELSLNFYNRAALVYSIDAAGRQTNYYYDTRLRLRQVLHSNPGPGDETQLMTYNSAGELLRSTVPSAPLRSTVYEFDHRGRLVQETSAGLTHNYNYDEAGNRTGVLYGGTGRRLVSTYDGLQRLQTCTETQDSVPVDAAHPAALTTYGYDVGSRILLKTLPNGTAEAKGYDAAGRTTTQITRAGPASGNTVFSTTTSRYDRFGRLAWQKEMRPATGALPAAGSDFFRHP
jgi:YD repeat-containing protein